MMFFKGNLKEYVETTITNEERLENYYAKLRVKKAVDKLQKSYDDYVNKRLAGGEEPDWWTYEDNDSEWIEKWTK